MGKHEEPTRRGVYTIAVVVLPLAVFVAYAGKSYLQAVALAAGAAAVSLLLCRLDVRRRPKRLKAVHLDLTAKMDGFVWPEGRSKLLR